MDILSREIGIEQEDIEFTPPPFIITELEWERIFLNFVIESDYEGEVTFGFKKHKSKVCIPIEYDKKEGNRYYFSINTVAVYDRTYLDNGRWEVVFIIDEVRRACFVTSELAYKFDQLTRIFRYGKNDKYAYTVNFTVYGKGGSDLVMVMRNVFMTRNDEWNKRKHVEEAVSKKGRRYARKYVVLSWIVNIFYKIFYALSGPKGKRVLIMAETKEYLWGNLKAIDERIKERGLDKEYKLTYSFRRAVGNHQSVFSWFKLIYKISKQDIIFVDDFVPVYNFLRLNKNVKLVQVWHAGAGFKAVGYCRFGKNGSPYPVEVCHKAYTHAMTGSKHLVKVFEEVFGIDKESIHPVGMPRLDHFLDEDHIQEIKDKLYAEYPYLKERKVILFAPTYRGTGQKTAHYKYDMLDLQQIYDVCGDEYLFAFKMHPFITELPEIPEEYADRIVDLSEYKHINDLYYISEMLITDYSSNFYEFSLMRKPILFYTYDREVYELTRGVYRSIRSSAPGKVCDTFEELIEAIKTKDFEYEKVEKFVEESFDTLDGHAADRTIDKILLNE